VHRRSLAPLLCATAAAVALPLHAGAADDSSGFAVNDGVKIWYRVEGTLRPGSVPLLLIHGGPGATARPFERTIGPEIAKTRPVVYMDYRGAGRSDRPADPAKYSWAILADDADAVRRRLGIERWAVFGHSNGGTTAITYAVRHPAHLVALVLCDPLLSPADLEMNMVHKVTSAPPDQFERARAAYKSGESMSGRFEALLGVLDGRFRYALQFLDPRNGDALRSSQDELAQEIGNDLMEPALIRGLIASGFFDFDAFAVADGLTAPVLVLVGRHDSEISVDNALRFSLAVPDGRAAILEHSGHHPYLEETALCARKITTFLAPAN